MKKLYIMQYEKRIDGLNRLIVADPDIKLDNGNCKVVSVLMAIFKNLLLGGSDNTSGQLDIYDLM